MTNDGRNLVKVLSVITVVVVGLTIAASFAAAVVVYRAGMIVVHVDEKRPGGSKVHFAVPGILASVGAAVIPHIEIGNGCAKASQFLPALDAAASELARCEDGVLVEVESDGEHVLIEKRDGSLLIDVDAPDAKVQISVPLHAITVMTAALRSSVRVTGAIPRYNVSWNLTWA